MSFAAGVAVLASPRFARAEARATQSCSTCSPRTPKGTSNVTKPPEVHADLPPPLVLSVNGVSPRIADGVFLAPGCVVVGDVDIGLNSSVWFGAVLRGDVAPIRIGTRTNVQDGAVLHVDTGSPCIVGDDVTIGHRAIIHAANVGNRVTIGM